MKLYESEVWLTRQYKVKGLSAKEIAKLCGVTEMTITRWLHKYNLVTNRRTW